LSFTEEWESKLVLAKQNLTEHRIPIHIFMKRHDGLKLFASQLIFKSCAHPSQWKVQFNVPKLLLKSMHANPNLFSKLLQNHGMRGMLKPQTADSVLHHTAFFDELNCLLH